jgi:hypothetical protein
MWTVFWGFVSVIGITLSLPPEDYWLRPYFRIGAAATFVIWMVMVIASLRKKDVRAKIVEAFTHPVRAVKKLEPIHVIFLGLFIAAIGVVWQLKAAPKGPSHETISGFVDPLNAQIADLKNKLAQANSVATENRRPARHIELVGTPPPRYTAYEKEQRLRAVDEIYTLLTGRISPVFYEGRALLRNFQDPNQGIDASTKAKLLAHAPTVHAAFADLAALFQKYEYYPDIIAAAKTQNPFNGILEENASANLADEIDFWNRMLKSEGVNHRDVWNRDGILQEFASANVAFGNYLDAALPNLKVKRTEIEAAAVYAP